MRFSHDPNFIFIFRKQYADAMKFLEEDVRLKQSEKQWKDNVRNAWEISPTLAIFLLKRLNTVNAAQVP
jgi:hypothetical protein